MQLNYQNISENIAIFRTEKQSVNVQNNNHADKINHRVNKVQQENLLSLHESKVI